MAKKKLNTFKRGVHFDDRKEQCADLNIVTFPAPDEVFIALGQHVGAPAKPVVRAGDEVKCGQLIAAADGVVSANIHASIGGTVKGIVLRKNTQGNKAEYVHIAAGSGQECENLLPLKNPSPEEIISRVRDCGIVGLGGAGFPTAVKLSPKLKIDTLLINAAECEPYLCCDYRLMIEQTKEIVEGAFLIAKALGVNNIIVGIEENKPKAVELFSGFDGITVQLLKTRYPQGAEKHLIDACLKRKVPPKKLPMDVGVVVQNVQTAFAVYEAVEHGKPLTSRVITVAGGAISKPANLRVKIGTSYTQILDYCQANFEEIVKFIDGGPMMGNAMSDYDGVVNKTTGGLVCLNEKEADTLQVTPCINCGRCARVCPMRLMPMQIDFFALAGDVDNAVKYGATNCCECGTCAYVCPAKRAIVQSVRLAKQLLRNRETVKK